MPRDRSLHRPIGAEGREDRRWTGKREAILVTRAMGGIGDLLMMTPGLHELKKKCPEREIHLAIPRQFKPLFVENTDITLLDIEKDDIDVGSYAKWFNFTDIPEAAIESRTLPNVKKNRIEIFARALGIRGGRLRRMDRWPRYCITQEEKMFQQNFWRDQNLGGRTVIGIQLKSAEPYRDYPFMAELIRKLALEFPVLLFHSEKPDIPSGGNVIVPGTKSLREAVALAAACDAIIAPDSAFVHFAGALNIPCIAIYGPIDGRLRTKDYPSCTYVDARKVLQCVPCWRNEVIPCQLAGRRNSACMSVITVDEIYAKLKNVIGERS
jgi:ADP-heptose:LPS heptosyltransferase